MILIIGPAYSGKSAYARGLLQKEHADGAGAGLLTEVQELVSCGMSDAEIQELSRSLCGRARILTASETGAGIVPADGQLRAVRENQGKLLTLLAQRADCVVRVFYGIPEVIKGSLPAGDDPE